MGGNVFKEQTRRYSKSEYELLVAELAPKFALLFSRWNVTDAFADKTSFGDLDVLGVLKFPANEEVLAAIFDVEQPKKSIRKNGSCWSLVYKEFQIDLITCPEKEYEFSKSYFSNDIGNFYGKLAHVLGLKFGHDGMWMVVRTEDNHQLGEILLTLDPQRAKDFLDVKPLAKPFESMEDIFEHVSQSKYFNPASLALENNNAVARVRDRKRPIYRAFLEWCEKLPPKEYFPRVKDKSVYLPLIFDAFPEAQHEYEALWAKKELLDKFRVLFNGDLVSEWLGLTGKELGEMMVILKQHLRSEYVVENMSAEDVKNWVISNYGSSGVYRD